MVINIGLSLLSLGLYAIIGCDIGKESREYYIGKTFKYLFFYVLIEVLNMLLGDNVVFPCLRMVMCVFMLFKTMTLIKSRF